MLQSERNLSFVFQVLARCPKTSDETCKIRIAETLVYQHGSLRVWYYTDLDNGEVLKRDRREWSAEKIVDAFCAGDDGRKSVDRSSCLPVAIYVHYSAGSDGRHSPSNQSTANSSNTSAIDHATKYCRQYGEDAEPLSVDYFDAETLKAFLATRENKHNVILQKFVRGRADHSSMVQVVWAPHKNITLQRQNIHTLVDNRVPLYQRCNTFDNTSHLSHEVRTTSIMSSRLDVECRSVVKHLLSVEQRVVTRMVAFFAFDSQRHPVFLFATEMQLTSQPATQEEVRQGLSLLMKRKLCMVSPPIIPSDVVFPDYARVSTSKAQGAPNAASIGISGDASLSVINRSSSTQICSALQKSGAHGFAEEMDALDMTFDSAYESRHDRGMLTDGQRKQLARSAFVMGAQRCELEKMEADRMRKQTSFLMVQKRFYTPDPLLARQNASRPSSALSMSNSNNSSMQHAASSILLTSTVRYTCGGGGGLYLRKKDTIAGWQEQRGGGSEDGAVNPENESLSLDLTHSYAQLEGALASLRSPQASPTKAPGAGKGQGGFQLPRAGEESAAVPMERLTSSRKVSQSWAQWKASLKAAHDYRLMTSLTASTVGYSHGLGEKVSPAELQRIARLRDDRERWQDVDLLDPLLCKPQALLALQTAGSATSIARLNLWSLFHPKVTEEWVHWAATMHRTAIDGIEECISEMERTFHTLITAGGGTPWCDVSVPLVVDLQRMPISFLAQLFGLKRDGVLETPRRKGSIRGGVPLEASKSMSSSLRAEEDDDKEAVGAVAMPWEVIAWVLQAILRPCSPLERPQRLPPPQFEEVPDPDSLEFQVKQRRLDEVERVDQTSCALTLIHFLQQNALPPTKVSKATSPPGTSIEWSLRGSPVVAAQPSVSHHAVLNTFTKTLKFSMVSGDSPAITPRKNIDEPSVARAPPALVNNSPAPSPSASRGPRASMSLSVKVSQCTSDKLSRIIASLRSLQTTMRSSLTFNTLECIHVLNSSLAAQDETLCADALSPSDASGRGGNSKRSPTPNQSRVPKATLRATHKKSAVQHTLPNAFIDMEGLHAMAADGDPERIISPRTKRELLHLDDEEWQVVRSTVTARLEGVRRHAETSNVEWPPRILFTPM